MLKAIRRTTGGADYTRLRAALERLTHTAVRTNIRAEGKQKFASFHWLDSWTETIDEASGEPTGMTLTLPDWLYGGIVERGGVLTINEDYFLLTGGIERWLYRVARKHGGTQEAGWGFTVRQLYEKSGSAVRFSDFAIDIRRVVELNQLPEYELSLNRNGGGRGGGPLRPPHAPGQWPSASRVPSTAGATTRSRDLRQGGHGRRIRHGRLGRATRQMRSVERSNGLRPT